MVRFVDSGSVFRFAIFAPHLGALREDRPRSTFKKIPTLRQEQFKKRIINELCQATSAFFVFAYECQFPVDQPLCIYIEDN